MYMEKNRLFRNIFSIFFLCIVLAECGCAADRAVSFPIGDSISGPGEEEDGRAETAMAENNGHGSGEGKDSETMSSGKETMPSDRDKMSSDSEEAYIYVHVCGAVDAPGVLKLPAGSRGEDALILAGGFSEDAAKDYINLAARLEDGQKLYFPTREEAELWEEEARQKEVRQEESTLVNINTAEESRLCTLPGIGESRAKDIIAYREAHGGFAKTEDIMKVSGIKESVYRKISSLITVE